MAHSYYRVEAVSYATALPTVIDWLVRHGGARRTRADTRMHSYIGENARR
jgi:hypothetical protein